LVAGAVAETARPCNCVALPLNVAGIEKYGIVSYSLVSFCHDRACQQIAKTRRHQCSRLRSKQMAQLGLSALVQSKLRQLDL
jgi:hypothetical protein